MEGKDYLATMKPRINAMMQFENDDYVKDMNLEAKLDKELLMHGLLRRDFTDEELDNLRAELEALDSGNCSLFDDFWSQERKKVKTADPPDEEPTPRFSVGDRVWVTENLVANGIPGVGVVRKVEKEWIDLGEELQGYWEISYQLRNLRTPFTEEHVFSTELEALAALASDFRQKVIIQANEVCKRMRALGMNITTKELLDNIANMLE